MGTKRKTTAATAAITTATPADDGDTLRYADAARLLGVAQATLRGWVFHRRVPHHRLSAKLVTFSRRALLEWRDRFAVADVREGSR